MKFEVHSFYSLGEMIQTKIKIRAITQTRGP
jgi:hypothetical protein